MLITMMYSAVKLTRPHSRLPPPPKSMHSIIDATQREQRHGLALNWSVGRGARANLTPHPAPVAPLAAVCVAERCEWSWVRCFMALCILSDVTL